MQQARLFLRLGRAEQALLLGSLPLAALVRLGLWLLPPRLWHPLLRPVAGRPSARAARSVPAERVAWAVAAASRFVPGATCLTQALAARLLLAWLGHPALVRIGVARDAGGSIAAHAWVESGGAVVLGGTPASLARYRAFPSLEGGGG